MDGKKYLIIREEVCWTALALCIMKPLTIEMAFEIISPYLLVKRKDKRRFEEQQMLELRRNGKTWPEIGAMFGCTYNAAYRRVKRFRERNCPN
jgi:hypothetical protein